MTTHVSGDKKEAADFFVLTLLIHDDFFFFFYVLHSVLPLGHGSQKKKENLSEILNYDES